MVSFENVSPVKPVAKFPAFYAKGKSPQFEVFSSSFSSSSSSSSS
jgi:hypothetical protein